MDQLGRSGHVATTGRHVHAGAVGEQKIISEEPIFINSTSGTTGRPKGVQYAHRGAYLNALAEVIETGTNFNGHKTSEV